MTPRQRFYGRYVVVVSIVLAVEILIVLSQKLKEMFP